MTGPLATKKLQLWKLKSMLFTLTSPKLTGFINKKIDKLSRKDSRAITGAEVSLKVVKPETSMNEKKPP